MYWKMKQKMCDIYRYLILLALFRELLGGSTLNDQYCDGDKCYHVETDDTKNWDQAVDKCISKGWRLAETKTGADVAFIDNLITEDTYVNIVQYKWVTIYWGLEVESNANWWDDNPDTDRAWYCAGIYTGGLLQRECSGAKRYMCEQEEGCSGTDCYHLFSSAKSWRDAFDDCFARGYHLLDISDNDEFDLITDDVQPYPLHWIGLYYHEDFGWPYSVEVSDESDGSVWGGTGDDKCARLRFSSGWPTALLDDRACNNQYQFACEEIPDPIIITTPVPRTPCEEEADAGNSEGWFDHDNDGTAEVYCHMFYEESASNKASSSTLTASNTDSSYTTALLVDGTIDDEDNMFSSGTETNPWIQLDLGASYTFKKIHFVLQYDDDCITACYHSFNGGVLTVGDDATTTDLDSSGTSPNTQCGATLTTDYTNSPDTAIRNFFYSHDCGTALTGQYVTLVVAGSNKYIMAREMYLYRYEITAVSISDAIGVSSDSIIDNSQMLASSYDSTDSIADYGRLDSTSGDGAWIPDSGASGEQWLQIDMLAQTLVSGVSTQWKIGGTSGVTQYKVAQSYTGITFTDISVGGSTTLSGSSDGSSAVIVNFDDPIFTRFLRFIPTASQNEAAMRVEVYGYYKSKDDCTDWRSESSFLSQSSVKYWIDFYGTSTTPIFCCVSSVALMATQGDPWFVFWASSEDDTANQVSANTVGQEGCWKPASSDSSDPWIGIELKTLSTVESIEILPNDGTGVGFYVVQEYRVKYSLNGNNYFWVKDADNNIVTFYGNVYAEVSHVDHFKPPVFARFFKIYPDPDESFETEYNSGEYEESSSTICMKIELHGCIQSESSCEDWMIINNNQGGRYLVNDVATDCDSDLCDRFPCLNGGSCSVTDVNDDGNDDQYLEDFETCDCDGTGFDGDHCENDIDECSDGSAGCDAPTTNCNNTAGSFSCDCFDGHERVSSTECEDIDECDDGTHNCHADATCTNSVGAFSCACNAGYSGDGETCTDIDECTDGTDNCDATSTDCTNTAGSFTCDCKTGYEYASDTECSDIDECSDDTDDCAATAVCSNTAGSFTCACPTGYEGDGQQSGSGCSDIDECDEGDPTHDCNNLATCDNTDGSFTCTCNDGWTGSGQVCSNLDECILGDEECDFLATCSDTQGSYICTCESGYEGTGWECDDVDECWDEIDECDEDKSECSNTDGAYTCDCLDGWQDTGDELTCENVDECSTNTDDCNTHASCTDNAGSFTCTCGTGWEQGPGDGHGSNGCDDVNECSEDTHTCNEARSTCSNTQGSFVCNCDAGWEQGTTNLLCVDINECSEGTDDCDDDATCSNNAGSFDCDCDDGYYGSGTWCTDIDECYIGWDNCHEYADCSNEIGSFTCDCIVGYTGNGVICVEIDECLGQTCSGRGECEDLYNAYKCHCTGGYWGDDCETSNFYWDTTEMDGALYVTFDSVDGNGDYPSYHDASIVGTGLAEEYWYGIQIVGKSVILANNDTSCLDFSDFGSACISDPTLCTDGASASIWVRMTQEQLQETGTKTIFSSGPTSSTGFALFRLQNEIQAIVDDGTTKWTVSAKNQITPNLWINVGFVWKSDVGLVLLVDTVTVDSDVSGVSSTNADVNSRLTIGCTYTGTVYTGQGSGNFDEFAFWPIYTDTNATTGSLVMILGGLDIDDCYVEPCVNGDCYDIGYDAWECDCHDGWNGTICNVDILECLSNPCQNGGTCHEPAIHLYTCTCAFGFSGYDCEIDLSPNYDYSNVAEIFPVLLVETDAEMNPYYMLAPRFWSLSTADPKTSSISINTASNAPIIGRGNLGQYANILTATDHLVLEDLAGTDLACVGDPDSCTDGLSMAIWVKLEATAKDNLPAYIFYSGSDPAANEKVGFAMELSSDQYLFVRANDGTKQKSVGVPLDVIPWSYWVNLAFTWHPTDRSLTLYINGQSMNSQARILTENVADTNTGSVLTVGSSYATMNSAFPMIPNDIVIWDRCLHTEEREKLLGMTKREFHLMMNSKSKYYWTSDSYVRRDHMVLGEYDTSPVSNYWNMTKPGEGLIAVGPSPDVKANSLVTNGVDEKWLYLGDFAGNCLSDPSLCKNGFTISLNLQMARMDNDTHFFISTGEHTSRGFSIFSRDQNLGAAVVDGNYRWVVEIPYYPTVSPATTYDLSTSPPETDTVDLSNFINLAITWKEVEGLKFYVDGILRAIDISGYRKIRDGDWETKLIVGRRNDYLGHFSNMTFEELAIWEKVIYPHELRNTFGFPIENINYDDTFLFWDALRLYTSTFDVLDAYQTSNQGPTNEIELTEDYVTIQDDGYIILGNFSVTCFVDLALCFETTGLTISFWVNFDHMQQADSDMYFYKSINGSQGIDIYMANSELKVDIITDANTISARYDLPTQDGEWVNIALTAHNSEGLMTIYYNGAKQTPLSGLTETATTLLVGGTIVVGCPDCIPGVKSFKIHSLALWDQYTFPRQIHRVMGLTADQFYYYNFADHYWPFELPLSLTSTSSSTLSSKGAKYADDRHNIGKSVRTSGKKGYISLGSNLCISNPSTCSGFILNMWLMLADFGSGEGYILSSGAQKSGEKGMSIVQKTQFMEVTVADGSQVWDVQIFEQKYSFNKWNYFTFTWSAADGLYVYVNGTEVMSKVEGKDSSRSSNSYQEVILGKSNSDDTGYLKAHFDDITLTEGSTSRSSVMSELRGDPVCDGYPSAHDYIKLATSSDVTLTRTQSVSDKMGVDNSAVRTRSSSDTLGFINVGDYNSKCLSDPSKCGAGVTLSVWMKLDSDLSYLQDVTTNPDGVGYILSTGAQSSGSTGFFIRTDGQTTTFVAHDGTTDYRSEVTLPLPTDEWFNIGLNFNPYVGIIAFINGLAIQEPVNASVTPSPAPVQGSDANTKLFLGRANDNNHGYLDASFDELAIWYYKEFNPDDFFITDLLLGDGCHKIVITSDHSELDSDRVWSGVVECDHTHVADCARDLDELNELASEEDTYSKESYDLIIEKVQGYARDNSYLTIDEMEVAADLFVNLMTKRELADEFNTTDINIELETLVNITSDMCAPHRARKWKTSLQTDTGGLDILDTLENYTSNLLRRSVDEEVSLLEVADNLALSAEKLNRKRFTSSSGYSFPDYSDDKFDDIKDNWDVTNDRIEMPQNFKHFIEDGASIMLIGKISNSWDDMMPDVMAESKYQRNREIKVNARVISLSIDPPVKMDFYNPVKIVLTHNEKLEDGCEPLCTYWDSNAQDTITGGWSSEGCWVISYTEDSTVCGCNHLTAFTVMTKPIDVVEPDMELQYLQYITYGGSIISIILLVVLLFLFICVKQLRKTQNYLHINLIVAMLAAKLTFTIQMHLQSEGDLDACRTVTGFLAYFYFAVFIWMLLEGIHLLLDFCRDEMWLIERLKYYLLVGWGTPGMLVGISLAIWHDSFGSLKCFLTFNDGAIWGFVGPALFIILVNSFILVSVFRNTNEMMKEKERYNKAKLRSRISVQRACASMLPFLGISWIFSVTYLAYPEHRVLEYIFVIFNSLQGVFMVLFFGIFNREVYVVAEAIVNKKDLDTEYTSKITRIALTPEPDKFEAPKFVFYA